MSDPVHNITSVPKPPLGQRVKDRIRANKTPLYVAATAVGGAVASYYGTTRAVRHHAIDIYFKTVDMIDEIAPKSDQDAE